MFQQQLDEDVYYKAEWVGTRRVDFALENKLMVEIKATSEFEPVHFVRIRNYVDVFEMGSRLLVNFGEMSLEYKSVYGGK